MGPPHISWLIPVQTDDFCLGGSLDEELASVGASTCETVEH